MDSSHPNLRFKYAWSTPTRHVARERKVTTAPADGAPDSVDYSQPWDMADIVFKVEGKRVYASKTILAMWSPVMKAMFVDDFKEKTAAEIDLPGKYFDDILELVKVLHPPNEDLHGGNVGLILPLAREYQMDDLTVRCERFLLTRPPSVQSLLLAEEFQLMSLQQAFAHCFDTMLTLQSQCMDYVKGAKLQCLYEEPEFDILSSDTKVAILKDKSTKYEHLLVEIRNVINGEKPEQVRFRVGGTLCTFTCTDKAYLRGNSVNKDENKDGRNKDEKVVCNWKDPKREKESRREEKARMKTELAHNSGTEKSCKTCALYMVSKIEELCSDLP